MIEDSIGEKFGYYLNTEISEKCEEWISTDNKSFHFNLQSNGRLLKPMKFEVEDTLYGGIKKYTKDKPKLLIYLGNIVLYKENDKELSKCFQINSRFNYHGIQNALRGKISESKEKNWIGGDFLPKRIRVIQMEMSIEEKQKKKQKEENYRKQLEDWTGLKCGEIIFDSNKDNWSINISVFDSKIMNKNNLMFII